MDHVVPPADDSVMQRAKVMKQVASLSMDHLRELRAHWYCVNLDCKTSSLAKGGFGIAFPAEKEPIFLLPCGHYLCAPCRAQLSKDGKRFVCKGGCATEGAAATWSYFSEREWDRLVPATHLIKTMEKLRRCGIACSKCSNDGYRKEIEEAHTKRLKSSPLSGMLLRSNPPPPLFRHPRKAIVYCLSCHPKAYTDVNELKKVVMCWHCAASDHASHPDHVHKIMDSTRHKPWMEQVHNRDKEMPDKERESYSPWNMVMLSREEMMTLCYAFFKCGHCFEAYVTSDAAHPLYRPPRFLPCGHVVCEKCMENTKNGDALGCQFEWCVIAGDRSAVERLPADFKMMLELSVEAFNECSICKFYHPVDQIHPVGNGNEYRCSKCILFEGQADDSGD